MATWEHVLVVLMLYYHSSVGIAFPKIIPTTSKIEVGSASLHLCNNNMIAKKNNAVIGVADADDYRNPTASTLQPQSPTFYRRKLPSNVISFSSTEGRELFAAALSAGGTAAFFSLIEQLQTQPEPAYCGLTTLVIILNALAVDPRRSWKGPWRWYEESMLNCCVDLEEVKATGITFSTFACLAKCQGVDVRAVHGSDSTVEEFRNVVKDICTSSTTQNLPSSFLVVSYTRKVLNQTGTGHFSPIGAYDEASDHVLVLDTARFKYGPHWVPLPLMFEALIPEDPDTGKSRGFLVLSYDGSDEVTAKNHTCHTCNIPLPLSVLFRSKKSKDFVRKEFKQYIKERANVTLRSVISFWTKDNEHENYIWELVQPQLQPVDFKDVQMVHSLRQLLKGLIAKETTSVQPTQLLTRQERNSYPGGACCTAPTNNSSVRTLDLSPAEALYVVYLASLSKEQRKDIVFESDVADPEIKIDVEDTVREQLLAEAALVSYAIETCDWDI